MRSNKQPGWFTLTLVHVLIVGVAGASVGLVLVTIF
jgi:hypothetical protein